MDIEQQRSIREALRNSMPKMLEVGKLYADAYPPANTPPAVLDAVTVAVPLRFYMTVMAFLTVEFGTLDTPPDEPANAIEAEEDTHL